MRAELIGRSTADVNEAIEALEKMGGRAACTLFSGGRQQTRLCDSTELCALIDPVSFERRPWLIYISRELPVK